MKKHELDFLFNPRSVAVIGVSRDTSRFNPGLGYLKALLDLGFTGDIYPVNQSGGEVFGLTIYSGLREIPGDVDYVICAIPAKYALELVEDCALKGVRIIHLFTSGFSELGDETGKLLERQLVAKAKKAGIRILGPNGMGVFYPRKGLSYAMDIPGQVVPKKSGPLGFISQSGSYGIYGITGAAARGIHLSKAISYGNGADINETDLLGYLAADDETEIIGAYLEGVKGGRRFTEALREAARCKPVIIFKAGLTDAGNRAASSHTGSLAGQEQVWRSLLRQSGAIQVHSMEELMDMALLFTSISAPSGKKAGIIGSGGGISVQSADDCQKAGLLVPPLRAANRARLKAILGTEIGHILENPIDTLTRSDKFGEVIAAVSRFDEIDLLMLHFAFDTWALIPKEEILAPAIEQLLQSAPAIEKPFVVVFHVAESVGARELAEKYRARLGVAGIPVFPSVSRAAVALDRYIAYHQRRAGQNSV